ncbi:recombinase family protein [Clostridium beijerinckii]|uniref:recombinase family protein n=1 Tax=Clostridium beijerinckii TaxID=1520 RepID=UPI00098C4E80|nr:recombinase family protein [Clostridium beijerinckii]MBA8935569.1 site-specific DNA recombinase [Clostridium beijerinckii]NRU39964.1 site-specific DNA recombinase [Clostridium beijerinckii]NSA96757.1 site-specific DNA recombinase [Clostridium beijerinckii]OOM61311.1 DNA-invertase hin [Clostridium beijerinckii]OOM71801.1 DNA-invertase hin [Clostridium beijerinckii]
MKRIAIYSRKSKETDKGESIMTQIKMCKDYFLRYDEESTFEVFEDEGFSGKNTDRPAFKRMMMLASHKKFDIVACYKVDRIARNIIDFMNTFDILRKNDVSLVSITEGFDPNTPVGMMMMTLIAGFAEMERMNIAQRIKDNMKSLAELGRWSGGTPPTGYKSIQLESGNKIITYLELLPEWKEKIKLSFETLANGHTIRQSANILNMPVKTVANIINNPTYCKSDELSANYLKTLGYEVYGELNGNGYIPYNRRPRTKNGKKEFNAKGMFVAVSKHEAIVDSDLWIAANEQIKQRGAEARPRISQNSFLAHLVKCSCGSGMYLEPGKTRKDGTRTYYFRCSRQRYDKTLCNTGWVNATYLEEDILESLNVWALDKSELESYVNKRPSGDITKNIKKIKKAIDKNNSDLHKLTEKLILLEGSAIDAVTNKMNEISRDNEKLNESLLLLERKNLTNDVDALNIEILQNKIKEIVSTWSELTIDDKQLLVKAVIKNIVWDGGKVFTIQPNL